MWIEQGFYVSAALLVCCLVMAWVWPRRDT
jgi:hypothetical protein